MGDSVADTALAASFGRAAEPCRAALALYIEAEKPGLHFERQTELALATLEECASKRELEAADIRLVRSAVSDAAAICRAARPDDGIVAVTACLEGVASTCDRVLGVVGSATQTVPWLRFLFDDADINVAREERNWRVRAQSGKAAEASLLDVALVEVLALSNGRVAQMTVQILDWYEHANRDV